MAFEYHDTWAGWVPVKVEAFKTKRAGSTVIRYRVMQAANGQGVGFAGSFMSLEGAIKSMRRYPAIFREVATA